MIPFSHEQTQEEKYNSKVRKSKEKAKHLSTRMNQFLLDLKGLKLKDIKEIRAEALQFLNYHMEYLNYEPEFTCGDCGQKLMIVRPGKHQCNNPKCVGAK